jgi:hypothetical protein
VETNFGDAAWYVIVFGSTWAGEFARMRHGAEFSGGRDWLFALKEHKKRTGSVLFEGKIPPIAQTTRKRQGALEV